MGTRFEHAVVTGGAGFLGSHLCDDLVRAGVSVSCVDSLITGNVANIEHLLDCPDFQFHRADVSAGLDVPGPVDVVFHLACPASPRDYQRLPLETLRTGSQGTEHALALADRTGARFLLASTSEVYGDPTCHPQPETYWGNVNPIGPRSVYDEAKRYAEALTMAYHRANGTNTCIARIFNTYGPRMRADDGRMVPTFVRQALAGKPITVTGDGKQTRSVSYVTDTVRGLRALAESTVHEPVNIGSPHELPVRALAEHIQELVGTHVPIHYLPAAQDDPRRRRADISRARSELGWRPIVPLAQGLADTVAWFAARSRRVAAEGGRLAGHPGVNSQVAFGR
ncbi:MAG TPA: UDP-glucuronic acid decarboxylase family protein [Pseudonocardiaceae bacterium]|nr:UDP-glucuronic acid decarboxylase family protein [Pseudonocardiaceae bacterium]